MTKMQVTTYQAADLAAARRAGASRKHIWANIRNALRIPTSVKLAVDTARNLYVKGTNPRQFLIADGRGFYSHAAADQAPTVQPTQVQAAAPTLVNQAAPSYRVIGGASAGRGLRFVSNADLIGVLRECGMDEAAAVPAGMPAISGDDVVVADDGLYFLADD
jgi:hypothetical protein